MYGPTMTLHLGRIYAWTGELDKAVDQAELLLTVPSATTIHNLMLDPGWKPIHDHPRFQRLAREHGVE
jgi:hypothetical protein